MPGIGDSFFIFVLALLLFGPKKLPVLARQLGKLMGDFRKASNEFRAQMEDELRISEQADRQKEIAAIEAAAPKPPAETIPEPEHPHMPPADPLACNEIAQPVASTDAAVEPLPIATSGELALMPPSTGLPVSNTSLKPLFESIPNISDPEQDHHHISTDRPIHTEPIHAEPIHVQNLEAPSMHEPMQEPVHEPIHG